MLSNHAKKLGELAYITVGYVGPMANEYVAKGIPFLRSLNVKPYAFESSNLKFITTEFHKKIKKSALRPKDVVVVRTGNPGASCVIPDSLDDANCSDLVIIRCGYQLDPYFVSYYINSVTHSQVKGQLVGAIQKHFNIGSAKELLFPDIEKTQQTKIASVLQALDKKIELNNRINTELEAMAKTLYDYWFVQFDFPFDFATGKPDPNGKPYKSSGGKMVYSSTLKREIPEGWEDGLVKDILGKAPVSTKILNKDIDQVGDIPVIDQSKSTICGFTDDKTVLISPDIAHLVFGDHTRAVKLVNFKYARGADGTQVLVSGDSRVPCYLMYQMVSDIDLSSYGYARHFKFLKESKILLPGKSVASQYQQLVEPFFRKRMKNTFENLELIKFRDWLLPMLMNGQVTIKP